MCRCYLDCHRHLFKGGMYAKSVALEEPLLYWDYFCIWEGRCDPCVYKIHAKLNIGKEMVRKFEPVTFSERLSSSGHVRGAQYVNVQL